jgi:hypothetical protein
MMLLLLKDFCNCVLASCVNIEHEHFVNPFESATALHMLGVGKMLLIISI